MLQKFLLLLITSLYTYSALEIEIGEAKQTFCDEYDSYIPSKPTSLKKTQVSDYKGKNTKTVKRLKIENKLFYLNPVNKNYFESSELVYSTEQSPKPSRTILLQKTELRI